MLFEDTNALIVMSQPDACCESAHARPDNDRIIGCWVGWFGHFWLDELLAKNRDG
jgi:hypothetical protein